MLNLLLLKIPMMFTFYLLDKERLRHHANLPPIRWVVLLLPFGELFLLSHFFMERNYNTSSPKTGYFRTDRYSSMIIVFIVSCVLYIMYANAQTSAHISLKKFFSWTVIMSGAYIIFSNYVVAHNLKIKPLRKPILVEEENPNKPIYEIIKDGKRKRVNI